MQGRYRTGSGVAQDVVVTDLSTLGCKIEDRFSSLQLGSNISIRIGNIGPIMGKVVWIENSTLGVEFESAIHVSVLEYMLTTIDGWSPPAAQLQATQSNGDEERRFRLRVRPATIDDVREALAQSQLSLPIARHKDLVEIFHRILGIVAIEEDTDGSGG
jgi:hypothetical protein